MIAGLADSGIESGTPSAMLWALAVILAIPKGDPAELPFDVPVETSDGGRWFVRTYARDSTTAMWQLVKVCAMGGLTVKIYAPPEQAKVGQQSLW